MTAREMLAFLDDTPDLDATIEVRTHDGTSLGGVCTIDTGYTQRTGDQYPPRLVLHESACDIAELAKAPGVIS